MYKVQVIAKKTNKTKTQKLKKKHKKKPNKRQGYV